MKYIKINHDHLKESDITKEVIRIKVLLINSKNEVLLGYSYNCYQFIGGHLEPNETLVECLNREVLEETGIELKIKEIEPFLIKEEYYKDYPEKNSNYNSKIIYFSVKTDLKPNKNKTFYTYEEKLGKFTYKYISLDNIEQVIIDNYKMYKDAEVIGLEMLTALEVYKEMYM